ncbi:SGNH/GDSL hydrolase family protein [Rhodobacteraceae bacterium D3-12]|nr:SGNH/GDSL hydrolase family protein [Rhodobacteraceae bacterium D3-12]
MIHAFDIAANVVLSPLLLAQALQVRRKALILPEPPGPRSGTPEPANTQPPLRLLILGDSSAAGVGATQQSTALAGQLSGQLSRRFALQWTLHAQTGETSASALARLKTLPDQPFDAAIVVLGVNDVTHLVPLSRWLAQRRALHAALRDRFGVTRIIASGLPPMGQFPLLPHPLRATLGRRAARFDAALATLCATDPNASHLPLDLPYAPAYVATDGFHPSETAYALWATLLAAQL